MYIPRFVQPQVLVIAKQTLPPPNICRCKVGDLAIAFTKQKQTKLKKNKQTTTTTITAATTTKSKVVSTPCTFVVLNVDLEVNI